MKRLIILLSVIIIVILIGVSGLWIFINWKYYYDYDTCYRKHLNSYSTTTKSIIPIVLNKNGDFEGEPIDKDWHILKSPPNICNVLLGKIGRNNSHGVGREVNKECIMNCCLFQDIPITDIKISNINVSGWIKTEGFDGSTQIRVICLNRNIRRKDNREFYGNLNEKSTLSIKGDASWTNVSMDMDVPLVTEKITIYCDFSDGKKGKVYFDDIEVKATAIYEKKDTNQSK